MGNIYEPPIHEVRILEARGLLLPSTLPSILVEGPTMTLYLLRLLDAIDSENMDLVAATKREAEEALTEALGIHFPDTGDDA